MPSEPDAALMAEPYFTRKDLFLLIVAVVAGVFFFSSLGRLWPLADTNLNAPKDELETQAREVLAGHGFELNGYEASTYLTVRDTQLDYLTGILGYERTQEMIARGDALVWYQVTLKRRGDTTSYSVALHATGRVLAWSRSLQEDEPAAELDPAACRALAVSELTSGFGLDLSQWTEKGVATDVRPARVDREFSFERQISADPELRERATVRVSGDAVTFAGIGYVTPSSFIRSERARNASPVAMQTVGGLLLSMAVIAAFTVFLLRLRDGSVRLGPAALWASVAFVCSKGAQLLQDAANFADWDPLWPFWVSLSQSIVVSSQLSAWMLIVLLAIIAAGDSIDRETVARRGDALFAIGSGRLTDPAVAVSVLRGFAIGLVCGGVMAASVMLIEGVAGGRIAIQPRGFFFFALNSSAPAISTLLFFLNIALMEELGYRFFCGAWLLKITGRRWVAIVAPAIVYGLTHTNLSFLPPSDPMWGRALTMTLVGCVWGWAFFRYGALAVVVSHFMADLFIFTWPRLASGDTVLVVKGLLTMGAPLSLALPALVILIRKRARPTGRVSHEAP